MKIQSEAELESALARLKVVWNAEPDTPEGAELALLMDLVEAYERSHHPIAPPSPEGMLRFMLDQGQLTPDEVRRMLAEWEEQAA